MDNSAAYIIMILSPILWLVSKLSIHYTIVYENIRKKHSKSYIRKNRSSALNGYFLLDYKNEINGLLFYANLVLGVMVIAGFAGSIVYLILAVLRYKLRIIVIPTIVCGIDIFLAAARTVRLIFDKLKK